MPNGLIRVTNPANQGSTEKRIHRSTTNGFTPGAATTVVSGIDPLATELRLPLPDFDTTYYVRVEDRNAFGAAYSAQATVTTQVGPFTGVAPGLTVTLSGTTATWSITDNSTNETAHVLERRTNGGVWEARSFALQGSETLVAGNTYDYRAYAYQGSLIGPYSAVQTVAPQASTGTGTAPIIEETFNYTSTSAMLANTTIYNTAADANTGRMLLVTNDGPPGGSGKSMRYHFTKATENPPGVTTNKTWAVRGDFNDSTKWTLYGTAVTPSTTNVSMTLPLAANTAGGNFGGAISVASWDMTSTGMAARFGQLGAAHANVEQFIRLRVDANNYIEFRIVNRTLQAISRAGGAAPVVHATTPVSGPIIVLFREAGVKQPDNTVIQTTFWDRWDASAHNWALMHSRANPIPVTSLKAEFAAGTTASVASPGTTMFHNVNPSHDEHTIRRFIKFPTNTVRHFWMEHWVKYSPNFKTDWRAEVGANKGPDWKWIFIDKQQAEGRWQIKNGQGSLSGSYQQGPAITSHQNVLYQNNTTGQGYYYEPGPCSNEWQANAWIRYRWELKFSSTATANDGIWRKWINNTLVINNAAQIAGDGRGSGGFSLGENMNIPPTEDIYVYWGSIRVWTSNPGWI